MDWEDSFCAVVLDVVTVPLRGGGPTVSPWETSGDVVFCCLVSVLCTAL